MARSEPWAKGVGNSDGHNTDMRPILKRWWFWVLLLVAVSSAVAATKWHRDTSFEAYHRITMDMSKGEVVKFLGTSQTSRKQ